jgi:hypothetical protein
MVCWSAGLLVCWSVGLLVCWSSGLMVCWSFVFILRSSDFGLRSSDFGLPSNSYTKLFYHLKISQLRIKIKKNIINLSKIRTRYVHNMGKMMARLVFWSQGLQLSRSEEPTDQKLHGFDLKT